MSMSINLTLPLQLADASGTIGIFLPEAKLQELLAERDGLQLALQETRQELERLRQQAEESQRQVRDLTIDRNHYERALAASVPDPFDFDEEKALALIAEAETNGVDSAEVLRQVEAICDSVPARGTHAG